MPHKTRIYRPPGLPDKKQQRKRHDERRGTASQRLYGAAWQRARNAWLDEHPLCVRCLEIDRTTTGSVVDHIIPHRGDYDLFWDRSNWQTLCETHHNQKTATEDGGFGRNPCARNNERRNKDT